MTELGNEGNFKPKSSPEERGGEVIVGQDTWAEISAAKGESKTIATFDLLDCEAVSIIIEGTDGVRTAYIQDYSPDKNLESVDVLAKNLERLKLIPKTTVTVGIMIPELVYFED